VNTNDSKFILRCIELAEKAGKGIDFPFGSLIVLDDQVIAERYNESFTKNEVYAHAELLALVDAQKKLTKDDLSRCTLYSSVEPCAMCSFAIQELNIKRVVFGLRSSIMGGYTKWRILQDEEINKTFPNTFGCNPEIIPDVLKDKVIEGWKKWNAEKWERLISKRVFK
jgi:tRNA(adenine34) deaminase